MEKTLAQLQEEAWDTFVAGRAKAEDNHKAVLTNLGILKQLKMCPDDLEFAPTLQEEIPELWADKYDLSAVEVCNHKIAEYNKKIERLESLIRKAMEVGQEVLAKSQDALDNKYVSTEQEVPVPDFGAMGAAFEEVPFA